LSIFELISFIFWAINEQSPNDINEDFFNAIVILVESVPNALIEFDVIFSLLNWLNYLSKDNSTNICLVIVYSFISSGFLGSVSISFKNEFFNLWFAHIVL